MIEKMTNRTVALAGILQAADLVNELANHGNCNQDAFATSINSIFYLDAPDIGAIYGRDIKGLKLGLASLEKLFSEEKATLKRQSLHYFFGMLHLERKLISDQEAIKSLRVTIEKAQAQSEYFQSKTHSTVLANLADAYTHALGKFSFRIMVKGNQQYLTQEDILNKIRTLLLAGIRSAVLWRQVGGNRWQLVFQRAHYLKTVKHLLATI